MAIKNMFHEFENDFNIWCGLGFDCVSKYERNLSKIFRNSKVKDRCLHYIPYANCKLDFLFQEVAKEEALVRILRILLEKLQLL